MTQDSFFTTQVLFVDEMTGMRRYQNCVDVTDTGPGEGHAFSIDTAKA